MNNLHLNRYLYGGKEYQDAEINGSLLGLYDFHARYYNPMLGRWFNIDPALQTVNPYLYCGNSPMMYVDKDGKWFGFDDLIAGIIGGVVNVVSGLITGDIKSFGHGLAAFGVGFAAGEATLYAGPFAGGAVMGAGNSTVSQGFNKGWNNINWNQVAVNTAVSAGTAYVGSQVSSAIAPVADKLTAGISSPVVQKAVTNSVTL